MRGKDTTVTRLSHLFAQSIRTVMRNSKKRILIFVVLCLLSSTFAIYLFLYTHILDHCHSWWRIVPRFLLNHVSLASLYTVDIEYVEYTDGTIAPASSINANPPPARTANSPVQRTPGRIADYDPLSEARPSPYSARQAATTVIYTSDKGPGAFVFASAIAAHFFLSTVLTMELNCMMPVLYLIIV